MVAFDESWEEIHKHNEWGRYPSESVIRFIARNYYGFERSKVKILDFGCGGGSHTWYLAKEGFDTYAFDGSTSAISKARSYLEKEGLRAELKVCDGIAPDYDDDFFDAIVDNVCIYANKKSHILKMYKECFRMLNAGGRLYTSVFTTKTSGYGTGECIESNTYVNITCGRLEGRGTVHFFTEEELIEVLKLSGFNEIHLDRISYTDCNDVVDMLIAVCCKKT